jgi:hypothetical protein
VDDEHISPGEREILQVYTAYDKCMNLCCY